MRTWIIGSGGDCDLIVDQPRVSRRHCRFTERADGHLIEDLGSSNGTYVNGDRIAGPRRVSAGDRITLGALVPMPWPPDSGVSGAMVLGIGRAADNDIVIDDARVSAHHARLIVSKSGALIEDAGSSNGTFLNAPDRRVAQALPLAVADTVYFGSLAVPAARLLSSRPEPAGPAAVPPPPVEPALRPVPPVPAPAPAAATPAMSPGTILLLAQAPALAILIVLAFGRQAAAPVTASSWPAVAAGVASTTFALAISAVWLGGSMATWATIAGRPASDRADSIEARLLASPARRIAALGLLGAAQCAVLLAIVHAGIGLRGPWGAEFGVLVLASAVGLALALAVFSLVRSPVVAVSVLLVAFVAMAAMGGRMLRLPDSDLISSVAVAMPSRWAFEGLLLLESEGRSPRDRPGEATPDLAEGFFPSAGDRMGPRADAIALGFMLIGFAGAAAYLSADARGRRSP